jgi:formylglycine-generating enzyme required for sulfatase activity
MPDIFISYAHDDLVVVQQLAGALDAQGWTVFWDRTIPAGQTWRSCIGKALEDARCVIVVWSIASIDSNWVLEESEHAKEKGILVPVFIKTVVPPFGFRAIQAADLVGWDGDAKADSFVKFRDDVSRLLGMPPILKEEQENLRADAERKAEEERHRKTETQDPRRSGPISRPKPPPEKPSTAKTITSASAIVPPTGEEQAAVTEHSKPIRTKWWMSCAVILVLVVFVSYYKFRPSPLEGVSEAAEESVAGMEANRVAPELLPEVVSEAAEKSEAGTEANRVAPELLPEVVSEAAEKSEAGTEVNKLATELLPEFVPIEPGWFSMGSELGTSNEQPVHAVNFAKAFSMSATEVTNEQYRELVKTSKGTAPEPVIFGLDDRPVTNVSWHDADAYAQWVSEVTGEDCGLPTEAEWEYAARAGTTAAYALPAAKGGSNDIRGKALANCDGCGSLWDKLEAAPVGSFDPNDWGLYDMHGNVWEWVQDCIHRNYTGAPEDGSAWLEENDGDCGKRVARGGSTYNSLGFLRSSSRRQSKPDVRRPDIGFRVVCRPH